MLNLPVCKDKVVILLQSLNIWSIVVTDEVTKLDKSKLVIELQLLNVYSIFST